MLVLISFIKIDHPSHHKDKSQKKVIFPMVLSGHNAIKLKMVNQYQSKTVLFKNLLSNFETGKF